MKMMFGCVDLAWVTKDISNRKSVMIRMGPWFWMTHVNVIHNGTVIRLTRGLSQSMIMACVLILQRVIPPEPLTTLTPQQYA
jgi:hypothetical protein